jgi:hypothetical protein
MDRRTALALLLPLLLAGCDTDGPFAGDAPAARETPPPLAEDLDAAARETPPPLAEDLDAAAFKAALVGQWESVWPHPSGNYVKRLHVEPNGTASVEFAGESPRNVLTGPYTLRFLRPPARGAVTLAQIEIQTPATSEPLILSRVNFGLHSAVPASKGLLLRIDKSRFGTGVLIRATPGP